MVGRSSVTKGPQLFPKIIRSATPLQVSVFLGGNRLCLSAVSE